MPGIQRLTVSRYDHLREPVLGFLRQWSRAGQVLIVAADKAAADEWARAACERALVGVHRMTLAQLAAALAARKAAAQGLAPVSRLVVEALAARVTGRALDAGTLAYFAPVARTPGFAAALAGTLAELRLDRIAPQSLAGAGGPAADLAQLLTWFGEELRERALVDLAAQYELALEVVRQGGHPLCGLPVMLVEVRAESALERALVEAMAARAPAVLDATLGATRFPAASSLESMQQFLFAGEVPERAADDSVDLIAASGEALECVEIARRIRAAAAAGLPFDGMAILLRAPERYQPMVEEALRRADVPGFFTRGSRRPYASGRAFLALLECAREGLTASRFAEYLSLGQTPDADETPAPARWERLLVDAAVVGGIDRWRRHLAGLAESLRETASAAEEESEREARARDAEHVDALAAFALPLVERLAELPRTAMWGEWLDALGELAGATLRLPEPVLELLDQLRPMADLGPVTLDDVLRIIEPAVRSCRHTEEGPRYGKVYVCPIEEARGMVFDLVFLPGLNEGIFPRPPSEDPLLLDSWRRRIPGARQRSREDNELLAVAAACARSRIVLSYSRLDLITGRQRVPSFYVFEALRAARGHGVDVRDIEREAERGAQTRIGWPAPADWRDAIDDAEFDLAVLRPAFDDPANSAGAGAYLTRINPHLVRSLRARGRRWRRDWYAEDGLVKLDIHALQVLEKHRLSARPYSVSALQQFAICPYRFALRAIHRLHPPEDFARIERMDPMLRGQVFHRAQFELLRDLRAAGALPVTADSLADALTRLDAALDRVAAEFALKVAPAIPRVWAAEVESLRADLRGWLQQSAASDPQWTPAWFELAFGLEDVAGEHDPASVAGALAVLDGSLLRGSIDLVERHSSGILRVVDHKTGSIPSPRPQFVGAGEVLQPVLYALAAEQALAAKVSTGRLSYATLRQNYQSIDIPINDFARQRAGQVLRTIDQAIHDGALPAAPREKACDRCDYLAVCGPYEEERVALKKPAELRALKDLRRMP